MHELSKGQLLQRAYRTHIAPYSKHVQCAVTLTLKQSAKIRVRRFTNYGDDFYEFWESLDDEKLHSTIRFFTANLTNELFGNQSKHKNKKAWVLNGIQN